MHDVCAEAAALVFDNDDKTPMEFVVSLLRTMFGKSERDAVAFTTQIHKHGRCACGPYPAPVGKALLEEAQQRIREAGHPLQITSEDAANAAEEDPAFCLCLRGD